MVHVPSALVGSICAGSGFLVIHREISHRSKLSSRWAISEIIDAKLSAVKQAISSQERPADSNNLTNVTTSWNEGIESTRKILKDTFFGDQS